MIGDTYFHLRSHLNTRLQALSGLLLDLDSDAESQAIAENLTASLKEPFVFVVAGELNVGKSTFLNALFGQDFSRTGVTPTTDKILFFKHGLQHLVTHVTPSLDEVQVPADFLRDFQIVDTPGTNTTDNKHQEINEHFVHISDLVILVFSAINPWGASSWQFLDKVQNHRMRNVIFVLQQCDLRTPEEMNVIIDYMSQLVQQRYGRDFPIFPVSAKKAYLARTSGIDRENLMHQSGFDVLEAYVSQNVTQNSSRLNKLISSIGIAKQLLNSLNDRIASRTAQARRAVEIVRELHSERELQVDRTLKKILPALDATGRDYQESCLRVVTLAEDVLATRQAFSRNSMDEAGANRAAQRISTLDEKPVVVPDNKAQSLEHRLFQELQNRSGDRLRQIGVILEDYSFQYDRFLHAQGRGSIFPLNDEGPSNSDPEIRRLFSAHADSTLRRFVLSLQLDEAIEPSLIAARRRSRWVPGLGAPAAICTAAAGYQEGMLGAGIALAAGFLIVGAAFLVTQAALDKARSILIERLEDSAEALRDMLAKQVQTDVDELFGRHLEILGPASKVAVEQEQKMLSQTARLKGLLQEFDQLEHEIDAARS